MGQYLRIYLAVSIILVAAFACLGLLASIVGAVVAGFPGRAIVYIFIMAAIVSGVIWMLTNNKWLRS